MVDWEKPPPGYPPPGYPPPGFGYPPPGGYGPVPPHLKPPSNIGWAVAGLLIFWPLGIPSLLAAIKVDDLFFRGDLAGAHKASADARKWGIASIVTAAVFFVLIILFCVVIFSVASTRGTT